MTVSADKIEMIEGDVMLCRDRMVVVICDATLERTTNGKGSATDFTLAELKQLETGMISSFDVNILKQIASMKNPGHRGGRSNHQKTGPFWCSFIAVGN